MPLKYWRTMLIASALGVCGLAVWAADTTPSEKPAAPMPAPAPVPLPGPIADAAKDDIFPRSTAADPSAEKEPARVLDLAAPPSLPVAPPVVPPPLDLLPAKADVAPAAPTIDLPPAPKPAPPPSLDPLPGAYKPTPPPPPLPTNDPPPLPKSALDP